VAQPVRRWAPPARSATRGTGALYWQAIALACQKAPAIRPAASVRSLIARNAVQDHRLASARPPECAPAAAVCKEEIPTDAIPAESPLLVRDCAIAAASR
jgi:hypothetical protein